MNIHLKKCSGLRFGICWILLVQNRDKCWAFVHTAMKFPVPYLLTGCGAAVFPSSTLLRAVCSFLYVLVRHMACSLCVVLCTGLS